MASPRRASSTLLHNAYSQNYSYLIKKPTDQYQVILEVADDHALDPRGSEQAVHQERRWPAHDSAERGDAAGTRSIGPQAVNHINQFTSVTMFFNLKPGYAIGPATQYVENAAKEILPPGIQGSSRARH